MLASLSLDLDNEWSYLRTHGDPAWESYPSYLPLVVPRVLDFFDRLALRTTIFIVGRDAAVDAHRELFSEIVHRGHEVGNHSYEHRPWLHLYETAALRDELVRTHEAIAAASGSAPAGFRGPGYSLSRATLEMLCDLGYAYDGSTLPTYIGPIARAYYFATAKLTAEEKRERAGLFGGVRDGLRTIRPYRWAFDDRSIVEIPVTTFPIAKMPIHFSYVLYLALRSPALALAYFRTAMRAAKLRGIEPSLLLHPLDFLGREDVASLAFFPAMGTSASAKLDVLYDALDIYRDTFDVVPMNEHARAIARRPLRCVDPATL